MNAYQIEAHASKVATCDLVTCKEPAKPSVLVQLDNGVGRVFYRLCERHAELAR